MKLKQLSQALVLVGFAGFAHIAAHAADEVKKVERIEVTGSNIKRTATETASPVQVIRAEEIKRSGATTTAEVLKLIPAISSGGLDDLGSGSGFSSGTATASLRGLGSSATLVLVNGRRMSPAAYADPNSGQSTLYNLNNIPPAVIERIEVFKDGASAVYGSDAIAGVINFILKKEYQGLEMSANATGATQGGYRTDAASAIFGVGNLDEDRWNVYVSADYRKRHETDTTKDNGISQDLYAKINQRLDPHFSTASFPGNYYREATPGSGAFTRLIGADASCPADQVVANSAAANGKSCWFNTWPKVIEQSDQKSGNLFARGAIRLSDSVSGFSELSYNETKSKYPGNSLAMNGNSANTWFTVDGVRKEFTFILPANHPDNPLFQANPNNTAKVAVRYRMADVPVLTDVTTKNTRAVFGLEGNHFDWDWKAGLLYNKAERETSETGRILAKELQDAINDLSYRPTGHNSAATLAKISPTRLDNGKTEVTIGDLRGSTEFGQLAGGSVGVAVGVEARRESIDVVADQHLQNAEFIGLGSSTASGSRNVQSVFGELSLPVLKALSLEAALRYDHYSDFGNSTTPKVGFKWTPDSKFSVRGTYAEGFRAPGLTQISKSSVQSFNSGIIDPIRCAANVDPASRSTTTECTTGITLSSRIAANPDLQPEKSKSYTFGFVFAPTNNLNGSVDVYEIRRRNEIDRLSSQFLINQVYKLNNMAYVDQIQRSASPDTWVKDKSGKLIPNSGLITSTTRKFFNLGETRTKGIDLDLRLKSSLGEYGRLTTAWNATYLLSYKQAQFAGDPFTEYAGSYGPAGELPRFKSSVSTDWERGAWTTTGRLNYTGGWLYGDSGECSLDNSPGTALGKNWASCHVGSWTTVDLGLTYKGVKNLTLTAVMRNVANRKAPYDPDNTTLGYNPGFHNPYGRYLNLGASYKFW
ncbi:TonB-dependent receptor [Chitinimonas sp.]|uniref:TonB-dependent receptor plug domain-containing protein n=1 Tax=Chitinimonas sp. TaxID=1934313 RepID=UPI002F925C6B